MDLRLGQGRRGRLGWLAWIVLAAAWFATLQVRPLLDPDEGRYAEIPREMLASGDWITPHLNDLKYFEKPPLQYWATAVAYEAFGLRQWSSRLWSVGLAFACLPLVFAWVARLYGRDSALLALTALAVSPFFVIVGHLNLLDGGFTFWLTAAVLAFTLAQTSPPESSAERRWMLGAWGAGALAVLSKGIVVGVLAGAALILYTLSGDTRTWRRLHLGAGLPLFAAVAAPWFVVVSLRNPSFPEFFFVHEHFTRFLTTVHQRVEPWWYFLPLLLLGVLPWIAPLARACRRAWAEAAAPDTAAAAGCRCRRCSLRRGAAAVQTPQVPADLRRGHAGVLLCFRIQARPLHPAHAAGAGGGDRCTQRRRGRVRAPRGAHRRGAGGGHCGGTPCL